MRCRATCNGNRNKGVFSDQVVEGYAKWAIQGRGGPVVPVLGGEGRFLWFNHTSARGESWINIGEVVLVYPDEEQAREGWAKQREKYFPSEAWEEIPELVFPYRADEMEVRRLEGYVNGFHHHACGAVGRYGRVVIVVLGNVFDDRWLTMEEFREVLEAADRRAAEAVAAVQR